MACTCKADLYEPHAAWCGVYEQSPRKGDSVTTPEEVLEAMAGAIEVRSTEALYEVTEAPRIALLSLSLLIRETAIRVNDSHIRIGWPEYVDYEIVGLSRDRQSLIVRKIES